MKTKTILIVMAAAFLVSTGLFFSSGSARAADKVWVAAKTLPNGTVVPGHWRPATKAGFVWIDGHMEVDTWVPGYWKPVGAAPAGKIWVKGYWRNGKWHTGYWGPVKKGRWAPGHYGKRGNWIPGHYR